jgi:hypothetical protein
MNLRAEGQDNPDYTSRFVRCDEYAPRVPAGGPGCGAKNGLLLSPLDSGLSTTTWLYIWCHLR